MQRGEECSGLDELTRASERALIDCFKALDGGATSDHFFASYPQQAESVRDVLDMRAQLLTLRTTAPSPTTFASGREALLARVVRPLASSHPGSMETQGRQARGLNWRPATRAAFAGALLFAMTSCAIGVSATPAGDKARHAIPDIPTIDVPEQRAPYPFPQNGVDPEILPTEDPALAPSSDDTPPVETPPPSDNGGPAESPAIAPADETDQDDSPGNVPGEVRPVLPDNLGDLWLPPINAEEDPIATDPPSDEVDQSTDGDVLRADDDDGDDDDDEHGSRNHRDADESSSPEDRQSEDHPAE
jgi:hypothetical protein